MCCGVVRCCGDIALVCVLKQIAILCEERMTFILILSVIGCFLVPFNSDLKRGTIDLHGLADAQLLAQAANVADSDRRIAAGRLQLSGSAILLFTLVEGKRQVVW